MPKHDETGAVILRRGLLDMQVCVPSLWGDSEVIAFAELHNPAGTTDGWQIRKDAKSLNGNPERNPCESRTGYVHIALDA